MGRSHAALKTYSVPVAIISVWGVFIQQVSASVNVRKRSGNNWISVDPDEVSVSGGTVTFVNPLSGADYWVWSGSGERVPGQNCPIGFAPGDIVEIKSTSAPTNVFFLRIAAPIDVDGLRPENGCVGADNIGMINLDSMNVKFLSATIRGGCGPVQFENTTAGEFQMTMGGTFAAGISNIDALAGAGISSNTITGTLTFRKPTDGTIKATSTVDGISANITFNGAFSGAVTSNGPIQGEGILALSSPVTATNCIVYANLPGTQVSGTPTPVLTYCDVQGGYSGTGNLSDPRDPLFVWAPSPGPDSTWGTVDDDYGDLRLSTGSPCIDAGNNAAVPANTVDLDGDSDVNEPIPFGCNSPSAPAQRPIIQVLRDEYRAA